MSDKCTHEATGQTTNTAGNVSIVPHHCCHHHHCCQCFCPTCGMRLCYYGCYCCCHHHHYMWPPYTITVGTTQIGQGDTTWTWKTT